MTQTHRDDPARVWDNLSFLAPPGRAQDWRMVLLFNAISEAGVFSMLPAAPADIGHRLGLDGRAVRVALDALAVWGVIELRDGRCLPGPELPDSDAAAVLRHHARAIRLWAGHIDDRLRGRSRPTGAFEHPALEVWLAGLAVNARASAPEAADACLDRIPKAGRALDLGGGHGEYALEFARRGLRTTMQDRPEVIELHRRRGRLEDEGVELFAGDFFEVLAAGPFDIVFCAGVSYTYGETQNLELYRRVRSSLAEDGMLAILTFLRGDDPVAPLFAVQMLTATAAGDTHSEEEHRRWLREAGFSAVEVRHQSRPGESILFASI